MADEKVFSLKRYWVGWMMPTARMEWHERRKGPPPFDVWVSGTAALGDWTTLVCVADAVSENQVWRGLQLFYGSTIQRRFIEQRPHGWTPGERFPGHTGRTTLPDKPNRYVPIKERKGNRR